jgi:hypothetical protein
LAGVTKWRGILTLGWQFVVDCRKTGDRLRKSGKLRILKFPIRKSGRMVEIGKIPPESGKLAGMGTNYPCMKEIQVCSNKGPSPLQRGGNHKNVKIGWVHLKIFYSRITGPILIDLAQIILRWRRFKLVQTKGITFLQGEMIVKNENTVENLLKNQQAKFNQTYYKLSLGEGNSSLFK